MKAALAQKKDGPQCIIKFTNTKIRNAQNLLQYAQIAGGDASHKRKTTVRSAGGEAKSPPAKTRRTRGSRSKVEDAEVGMLSEEEEADTAAADPSLQQLVHLFPEYFKKVQEMMGSTHESYSQRGRHLLQLGKWAVVDAALAGLPVKIGNVEYSKAVQLIPKVVTNCVKDLTPFSLLTDQRTALGELAAEGRIQGTYKGIISFWTKPKPHEGIPLEVVTSVMTALQGNETASAGNTLDVEAQTKFLISRIIYDTISFLSPDLVGIFEYTHTFEGSAKTGLRRSDLTVAAQGGGGIKFGVLVTEFERGSGPVHKDFEVCTAEAVLELTRLLISHGEEKDLESIRVHRGLVGGSTVELSCIAPVSRPGGIVYIIDRRGPKLDLGKGTRKDRLFSALKLVEYIKSIVIPDGLAILRIISRPGRDSCPKLIKVLPTLPSKAPCPRITQTEFTPAGKRTQALFEK